MDLNLYPALKRLKTETLPDDENGTRTQEVASDGSKLPISELSENVTGAQVNIFIDDILPEIFDNMDILTTQDLLNFRLVNRCWRDSSTSILLKRNLCQIVLNFGKVTTDDDGNTVCKRVIDWMYESLNESFSPASFKYFCVKRPGIFLEDLNQLISTSRKFPCVSMCFYSGCASMILHPPSKWPHAFPYQADLLQFFALYGMEMRELSLSEGISNKALQNLLYVHMPHLTCLDFANVSFSESKYENFNESQMQVCLPFPSILRIVTIMVGPTKLLGYKKNKFLKELISVCPNLRAIYCAGEGAFATLIEIGKYNLIKELNYSPISGLGNAFGQVSKLVKTTVFEKKLPNIQLDKYRVSLGEAEGYGLNWSAINIILSSSKDSLKFLKLNVGFSTEIINVFVPRLPYLEYLDLTDYWNTTGYQFNFLEDVIGHAIKSGELSTSKDFSDDDFKALILRNHREITNIPSDYFPRLRKVRLSTLNVINKSTSTLMGFFTLEHLSPDGMTIIPGDIVVSVTTLEINSFPCNVGNMSKLFPNVSHLSVSCSSLIEFRNWVWTAFPKLEKLKISAPHVDDNNSDVDSVDCFFTGISQESLLNFNSVTNSSKLHLGIEKDFERTQPYIGDCKNLKEFTIHFRGKCKSRFASDITAVYGFQKVIHQTKIIFSFEGPNTTTEEVKEALQNLEPVAAYVEIQMNKSKTYYNPLFT